MKNIATILIGILIVAALALVGYWFWVPDVGALRTWDEFLELPTMKCEIGDASVEGLTGTMYVGNGRLRADYKVEGQGVSSTFHTIVYEDGTAYTWADNVDYSERSVFNLGNASTESNLFSISRCKRIWNLDPQMFVLPTGKEFRDRMVVETPQATSSEDAAQNTEATSTDIELELE